MLLLEEVLKILIVCHKWSNLEIMLIIDKFV